MKGSIRWLNTAACVAGLLWISSSLATAFWLFVPGPGSNALSLELPADNLPLLTAAAASDVHHNTSFTLFQGRGGTDNQRNSVGAAEMPVAASTRLELTLEGAVASSNPARARAILSSGEERVSLVPGDPLPFGLRGVSLVSVSSDSVVLENNGRHETLWMYEPGAERSSVQNSTLSAQTRSAAPDISTGGSASYAAVDSLTDVLSFSLYRDQGRVQGLLLKPKANHDLFYAAGFLDGDVLTAIDGQRMESISAMETAARSLSAAQDVTVEVLRQGISTSVHIDIARLRNPLIN